MNQSCFFICFFNCLGAAALIASSIYHCSFVRQKQFSRKVEMSKVESFCWNKLSSKSFSFESEQLFYLFFSCLGAAALIASSIYHSSFVRKKQFSRKVEMSKVESFYWNKLSSKSCSFELEQFFDLCFVLVVQGDCIDNIQYIQLLCCKTKGIFQESWNEQS